jgi:TonB family protein
MSKTLLAFAGAAVLSAASLTLAHASAASDAWIAQTKAAFAEKIAAAGLADDGKAVALKVTISANPDGNSLRVVRTSGSGDFDAAAKAAVKDADLKRPPSELVGRTVTFTLGDPAAGPSETGTR